MILVSDVHCDYSNGFMKLLDEIVSSYGRVNLVAAGDWGFCDEEFFKKVSEKVSVYTIYGNNDIIDRLEKYFHLIKDGEIIEIEGIKISGINGIVSPKGTPNNKGVPRKRPEEFIEVARSLQGKVDLLVLHETPYIPTFFGKMWRSVGTLTALEALRIVKPRVVLVGHLHAFACGITTFEHMRVVHVDSSVGGYAIYREGEVVCGGPGPARRARAPHPWPLDDPAS